jgi:hypothetical protein
MNNPTYPIKLKSIVCTCGACPVQWEGLTEDNKFFYLRYRCGNLKFGIWENEEEFMDIKVNRDYLYNEKIGGDYDGVISIDQLKEKLKDLVIFPDNDFIKSWESIEWD